VSEKAKTLILLFLPDFAKTQAFTTLTENPVSGGQRID